MAPQVGFEPTTLRLTAPEIWFSRPLLCIVIADDAMREDAYLHELTHTDDTVESHQNYSSSEMDCDGF